MDMDINKKENQEKNQEEDLEKLEELSRYYQFINTCKICNEKFGTDFVNADLCFTCKRTKWKNRLKELKELKKEKETKKKKRI